MNKIILAILLVTLPATMLRGQDTQESIEICSILEHARINCLEWDTADFLVMQSQIVDSSNLDAEWPSGRPIQVEKYTRVVFDRSNRKFAFYTSSLEYEINDLFSKEVTTERRSPGAFCFDSKKGHAGQFKGAVGLKKIDRSTFNADQEMLRHFRFPDYRGIWFALRATKYNEIKGDQTLEKMISGKNYHSSEQNNNNFDIWFDSEIRVNKPGAKIMNKVTFDLSTSLPIGGESVVRFDGGEKKVAGFKLEWKKLNDVMVPILASKTLNSRIRGSDEIGRQQTAYHFHWFSVNEPLDDDLFSIENISQESSVLNMVDPVKTGADSLSLQPEQK